MTQYQPQGYRLLPPAVKHLLIINVLCYLLYYALSRQHIIDLNYWLGIWTPSSGMFRIWQPLTHMFMHGGFWHLFFNMYTLLMFGAPVERAIGERKFLIFYFICGFGAMALHWGVQWCQLHLAAGMAADILSIPTVGASGAIYGVLIAFAMLYPDATLVLLFPPIPLKAKWWVLIFAGIEVVTGITGTMDGIAHFAHLGGMLIGFLLMLYWRKSGKLWQR